MSPRRNVLNLSGETLMWPEHHIDGTVLGFRFSDDLANKLAGEKAVWQSIARSWISGECAPKE